MTESDLISEVMAEPVVAPVVSEGVPSAKDLISEVTETVTEPTVSGEVDKGEEAPKNTDLEKFIFDLKVNGEDVKKEYNREQIIAELQKVHAANKQFTEAAQIRKDMEGLLGNLKDPSKAEGILLRLLGQEGAIALSQKLLAEEYDKSQWEPERRALYDENQRLKMAQEEKDEQLSQVRSASENAQFIKERDQLANDFIIAAEKNELPKDKLTIGLMADVMRLNNDEGIDITADEAAKVVSRQLSVALTQLIKGTDEDKLATMLGEDVLKKMNKWAIKKVKTVATPPPGTNFAKSGRSASNLQEQIKEADYDATMREIFNEASKY